MRKKFIIPFVAAVLFGAAGFTTVVKSDFFEIAKQLEIFTSLYKELNMNYVDQVSPSTYKRRIGRSRSLYSILE
jgi:carboxyl-terminal processing protease